MRFKHGSMIMSSSAVRDLFCHECGCTPQRATGVDPCTPITSQIINLVIEHTCASFLALLDLIEFIWFILYLK
jgi:hypothetical protein